MASSSFKFRTIFMLCWIAFTGCQAKQPTGDNKVTSKSTQLTDWYGVYASVEEGSGGEGQILILFESSPHWQDGGGGFRLKAWTDFGVSNGIEENVRLDQVSGTFLTSENQIFIAVPEGRTKDGKVTSLTADVKRYTRVTINQQVVLLADHALERYKKGESLKTTGVLIKLSLVEDDYRDFDINSLKSLPSENRITN